MVRYEKISKLEPGTVEQEHFSLLINISSIRSRKVIHALEDYFVNGVKRKIICERYNVNPGYLSLKIREIQSVSSMVYRALPFYIDRLVRV
ncbi:PapB/FocB family fimbrial expression transcriptional regulator [Citrobacter sp. S-77]|uniref:PapB/FocB family fimbrial expression transcriptional regulator n=1 Tax=Citrobacter sp. S-77 TaxID=1080067 RepID=UPI0005F06DCF|nr:PapB/FocB family fimbrial expression transcriptional regulator [Citrobacter sp. S-77]